MGELPSVDTNQDPSSYFLSDQDVPKSSIFDKVRPVLTTVKYYAVQASPYVSRILSATFYFLLNLGKSFVRMMIDQIKNFKGE